MTFADLPQSHSHGPQSSHDAEERHRKSGRMRSNGQHVLSLVKRWPNFTSRELFETRECKLDCVEVRRRLNTLMLQGWVEQGKQRRCTVAKTQAVTWREAADSY